MMERFWSKTEVGSDDECWPWIRSRNKDGYGTFGITSRKTILAHRMSWQLENGEIPEGMYVLHSCDNPSCVNPKHLSLGTQADNVADCARKGRRNQVRYPKLSAEQRAEIKSLYATGKFTLADLGRQYGVRYQSIRRHV